MKKHEPAIALTPLDRIKAIATRPAPEAYISAGGNGKRATRSTVFKQGIAILAYGEKLPVVIRNLSATGCRIEYFQNRQLEGRLLLIEPSARLHQWGEVVWNSDGASGIAFDPDTQEGAD